MILLSVSIFAKLLMKFPNIQYKIELVLMMKKFNKPINSISYYTLAGEEFWENEIYKNRNFKKRLSYLPR
ncbi:hypothetical protein LCGC14_1538620 [marine sediment metagenome]|uniref:Uncharacterized protein n=1 Tax=marine sediment metagenome TaxID=412755 RepID=A0A0F9L9T1_9ZZZZ